MSGVIVMHMDNEQKHNVINELKCYLESLHSYAMNENDVVKILTRRKDHLKKSHSIICENLPKENSRKN